jgi:hypothetical protein
VKASRGVLVGSIVLWLGTASTAQTYPRWFLDQEHAASGPTVVGYAHASIYPDSSAAQAIRDGSERWVRQRRTELTGGQLFWQTAIGTAWMGSSIQERFDATAVGSACAYLVPVDTLLSESIVAVLLGPPGSMLDPAWRQRQAVAGTPAPAWAEQPPEGGGYIYAVGLAPAYHYEMSSWDEAERNSRVNLARAVRVTMAGVQNMGIQEHALEREQLSVVLANVQALARWRDLQERVYYVLVRMPR